MDNGPILLLLVAILLWSFWLFTDRNNGISTTTTTKTTTTQTTPTITTTTSTTTQPLQAIFGIAYICRDNPCSPQEYQWMGFARDSGHTVVGKPEQEWTIEEMRRYKATMLGPGASSVESDTLKHVHKNYGIGILELVDRPKNGQSLAYVDYVVSSGINSAIILVNHPITQGFQVGDFFIVNQGYDDPYRCYALSYKGVAIASKGSNQNKPSVIAYESPNGKYVWIPFIPVVMSPYGVSGPGIKSQMFIRNAINWLMFD